MALEKRYKTKPLEVWKWGKELRAEYHREILTAREEGKFISTGSAFAARPVLAGFGDEIVHRLFFDIRIS